MNDFVVTNRLPDIPLWQQISSKHTPLSFDLELTARCNNDCRHCYINLPAGDARARRRELSVAEIDRIASQAVELGALWCLITGGEPLLRKDFAAIYLLLKRKGLLISVFTNACLVTEEHVQLFKQYPPRDVEITVYGVTQETYERVSRKPGSFQAFLRGVNLLISGGVKVRLKAMAIRSNVHEMEAIGQFCRSLTKDYYRFDPLLHLRHDGNHRRNMEILEERLSAREIAAVEQADPERSAALQKDCDQLILKDQCGTGCSHLFHCGAGLGSFSVRHDGFFRLCSTLNHPDCILDLRTTSLAQAWKTLVPKVREMESESRDFRAHCRSCPLVNICLWCPAIAHLEVGVLDGRSSYFCEVANARAEVVRMGEDTSRK